MGATPMPQTTDTHLCEAVVPGDTEVADIPFEAPVIGVTMSVCTRDPSYLQVHLNSLELTRMGLPLGDNVSEF